MKLQEAILRAIRQLPLGCPWRQAEDMPGIGDRSQRLQTPT